MKEFPCILREMKMFEGEDERRVLMICIPFASSTMWIFQFYFLASVGNGKVFIDIIFSSINYNSKWTQNAMVRGTDVLCHRSIIIFWMEAETKTPGERKKNVHRTTVRSYCQWEMRKFMWVERNGKNAAHLSNEAIFPTIHNTVASAIEAVSLFPWNKSKSFFFAPSCGQMVNLFSLRTAADVFSHRHSNFFRYFVFLACVCLSSDMINCNWNLSSPLQTPNGSAIRNHRQCLQKMRNLWPMVPTNLVRHNFYFVSLR